MNRIDYIAMILITIVLLGGITIGHLSKAEAGPLLTNDTIAIIEVLEDIRDNGDEIISKLDQIAENTRECK